MIKQVLAGSKPMHMNHAKILHNEGVLDLNCWADIKGYLKKEEEKAKANKAS